MLNGPATASLPLESAPTLSASALYNADHIQPRARRGSHSSRRNAQQGAEPEDEKQRSSCSCQPARLGRGCTPYLCAPHDHGEGRNAQRERQGSAQDWPWGEKAWEEAAADTSAQQRLGLTPLQQTLEARPVPHVLHLSTKSTHLPARTTSNASLCVRRAVKALMLPRPVRPPV